MVVVDPLRMNRARRGSFCQEINRKEASVTESEASCEIYTCEVLRWWEVNCSGVGINLPSRLPGPKIVPTYETSSYLVAVN
ncbi:hypothetical protein C5167_036645 [Papaver somniferum]|uniref:Uncharacterized protein n=1 Tax=Papaver somniferum TaxID=3469 RepID=A0A4Y7I7M7_PAPSO|nr:hypothetical protein C5167_036645 [Papaver somniferum]